MQKKAKVKKTAKKNKKLLSKHLVYFFSIALLLSLFLVVSQVTQRQDFQGRSQTTNCTVPEAELAYSAEEQKLVDLINAYRVENGIAPLAKSETLTRVAVWTSIDMNNRKVLDHVDSIGREYFARRTDCGYFEGGDENIAVHSNSSAQAVFDMWKNSTEGHNENMLEQRSVIIGIGNSGDYWTFESGFEADTNVQPTAVPTDSMNNPTIVPSPNCLGACPTTGPSNTPAEPDVTQEPTTPVNPTEPEEPEEPDDTDVTPTIAPTGTIDTPPSNDQPRGFFGFFFAFLLLIMEFFLSMFDR